MKSSFALNGGHAPRRLLAALAVVGSLSVLAGCAHQSASSSVYTYGQAQREQIVRLGTVESVRQVVIQNDRTTGAGTLAGAALGGVADRKSTRLNSSHVKTSYAVFCLKK